MTKFANMQKFEDGLSFSPVFKPNKGNVVNLGNINTKNVTLIGNKILLKADTSLNKNTNKIQLNTINADNIELKGNEIYADVATIKTDKLDINSKKGGTLYLSATGYYYDPLVHKHFDNNIIKDNGQVKLNQTHKQYISLNNDYDWWHFAKGYSYDENNLVLGKLFRGTAKEFRLTSDIDFGANCENGKCTGQNYANYWIDLNGNGVADANEYTSMMIGNASSSMCTGSDFGCKRIFFNKTFNGQGYTLKNINIDNTKEHSPSGTIGIFNLVGDGGVIKNVNVDYMGGGIYTIRNTSMGIDGDTIGGLVGWAVGDITFSNINISNISNINGSIVGGFVGSAGDITFTNIVLNNIGSISSIGSAGGFAGEIYGGTFTNIVLNNIGSISADGTLMYSNGSAGGFAGEIYGGTFTNIVLNNIGSINASGDDDSYYDSSAGGFAGWIEKDLDFKNIYVYFNPGATINGDDKKGIFAGIIGNKYGSAALALNNINLYYDNTQFNGMRYIDSTMDHENKFSHSGTTYEQFRDDVFRAFSRQEGLVEIDCGNGKKCLIFATSNTPDKPNKPDKPNIPDINTDPDVSDNIALDSDDLYLEAILEVLKDLAKVYQVNIFDLERLLKDYQALGTNASTKAKAEFIKNHLLVNASLNDAIKIVESLDFILAYDKNGLKDYFAKNPSNSAKGTYDIISEKFAKVSANKEHIKNTIKELNNQVNQINTASKAYEEEFKALNDLINQYNTIIAKYEESGIITDQIIAVLKGLESQINNSLTKLNTKFLSGVNNNIVSLETIKADNQKDYFKINGSFMKLAKLNVKLAPIPDGSVDPEIPDRPDRPVEPIYPEDVNKPDQLFSQVSALDNDEDKEANIDEAATEQRLKTCIVSDNFKTMNPCVAGSM